MDVQGANGMELKAMVDTNTIWMEENCRISVAESEDGLILAVAIDEGNLTVAVFGRKESENFPDRSA